jgi:Holliday junction resolvase RusA-like endonuclease
MIWAQTIYGEPCSKANSRRHVARKSKAGKPFMASIKSKKALGYLEAVEAQVKPMKVMLEGDLKFTATIYYASRRPDLDASLILDALQGRVYANDRQVKEIVLYHGIDRVNPRAEITVETYGEVTK